MARRKNSNGRRGRLAKVHKGWSWRSTFNVLSEEVPGVSKYSEVSDREKFEAIESGIRKSINRITVLDKECNVTFLEIARRNQYFYCLVNLNIVNTDINTTVIYVVFVNDINVYYDYDWSSAHKVECTAEGWWEWCNPAVFDCPYKLLKKADDPLTDDALTWRLKCHFEHNKKTSLKKGLTNKLEKGDIVEFSTRFTLKNTTWAGYKFAFVSHSTFTIPDYYDHIVKLPNFRKRRFTVHKKDGTSFTHTP